MPIAASRDSVCVAREARTILAGDERIYDVGSRIWGAAMGGMRETSAQSDVAHGLWLIWGALTDMVDAPRSTATEDEANDMMRRAAAEWLAVAEDPTLVEAHWALRRAAPRPYAVGVGHWLVFGVGLLVLAVAYLLWRLVPRR